VGLWGILTRKNIIKMIIGFSIMDTGSHILIVALGYVPGGTAPIFSSLAEAGATAVVDPLPSALVLTAIVIGLAVTALMLSYAIKIEETSQTLSIDNMKEHRW
jgi:multicomponent Na+:H+ antiporter subunit C